MKKLLAAVFLFSAFAVAQPVTYPGILTSLGAPTGTCNSNTIDIDTTTGNLYTCPSTGVWNLAGGGSGGSSSPSGNNQLFSGGGVVWTGGLNGTVSAASYQIVTTNYTSPQTNITLAPADPSNGRLDAVVLNTSGAVEVITGTPSATPAAPSVNPATQLEIDLVLVPAGSSTPAITNEDVYIDNSEWTCAASTNFNCASTTTPYQGTYSIQASAAVVGNNVTLTKPAAGTITLASYSAVSFYILNNRATWPTNKVILISFYNGSTLVGTGVSIKNGVYGFNTANTSSYQQIVIPVAAFLNGSATTTVNKVVFQVAGGTSTLGFHLDTIRIQAGGSGGASGGGGTVTSVVGTSPIVVTNGTTTPVVSCPTCGTGSGNVTGPGSSTTGHIATYADGTGKVIADGGAVPTGTVTSIATTSPLGGGTITGSGTLTCTTCAVVVLAPTTVTINPGAIASGAVSSAITISATGVATTDVPRCAFSADPTGTTGYLSATGTVSLYVYPTANTVNIKVGNNTGSSITPGSIVLNCQVLR